MLDFTRVMFWFVDSYKVMLLLVYVLKRVIITLYLKNIGYDKWWLAMIPLGHLRIKRELSSLPTPLVIVTSVFTILAFYTLDLIFLLVFVVLRVIVEYLYSRVFIDDYNTLVWTFVPLAKYIFMIKEVIKCRN